MGLDSVLILARESDLPSTAAVNGLETGMGFFTLKTAMSYLGSLADQTKRSVSISASFPAGSESCTASVSHGIRGEHILPNYIKKILASCRIIISFWDLQQVSKCIFPWTFCLLKNVGSSLL